MRGHLFLFIFACLLLSATLVRGQSSQKTYYFASASDNHPGEPKFMDGIFMDGHHRKVIFRNVVDVKHPVERNNSETVPQPDVRKIATIDSIEEKEPVTVTKDASDKKELAQEVATANDTAETPATSSFVISRPVKNEAKDPGATRNGIHSVDEVVVDVQDEEIDPVIRRYAGLIEMDPADISNYPLYRFIDKWYGTGYKWGGTDSSGIDCSAFSQKLYGSVYGIDLLRTAKQQHRKCERFKHADEAAEGDLVFFHVKRFRISHVGVYLANGYFVHASRSQGVVISNLDSKYWRRRYAGCGRMQRVDGPSESDSLQ